jgi:type IV pilus assembly protein PilO
LNKLPWYAQLAMFVVIAAGGAGAFYYFYEMKQQAAFKDQTDKLAAIRTRINQGNATARQLPDFRRQVGEMEIQLEALKPILPEERDAGDLLNRIQQLAVQSNLRIMGFKPQPITTLEMHAEWPITLALEGNYHNLGMWLDKVSKFPRIINVGNIRLQQKEQPTPTATMDITCTATTFVLVEPRPEPSADAKKKAGAAKKAPEKKS